jgi:hypothetical protein
LAALTAGSGDGTGRRMRTCTSMLFGMKQVHLGPNVLHSAAAHFNVKQEETYKARENGCQVRRDLGKGTSSEARAVSQG